MRGKKKSKGGNGREGNGIYMLRKQTRLGNGGARL